MSRTFSPQAFLIYQAAYNGDNEVSAATQSLSRTITKNTGALIHSTLGMQKHASLGKLKGAYNPEVVISKIVAKEDAEEVDRNFLNIENHKLSSLVPEIRLYRVEGTNFVPFYFPVVSDYKFAGDKLDLSKTFSSNAAVIENFSVTMTGKNPYQASRKFLDASLSIKVDNISTLFEVPSNDTESYAKLADLFTIQAGARSKNLPGTPKSKSAGALNNGRSCRIAATLGYSAYQTDTLEQEELGAIQKSKMLINLYYKGHNLSMQPDGSAVVSVQYTGFLEAMKGDSQFNVLSSVHTKTFFQEAKADRNSVKVGDNIQKLFGTDKEKEKESKNSDPKATTIPAVEDITGAFYEIINGMFLRRQIWTTKFDNSYFEERVNPKEGKAKKSSTSDDRGSPLALYELGTNKSASNKNPFVFLDGTNIHYLNFGDFLDAYFKKVGDDLIKVGNEVKARQKKKTIKPQTAEAVLKRVSSLRQELQTFAILMCDFVFKKKVKGKEGDKDHILNISDVPISIDNLYTVIFDEITSKKIAFYDVNDFVTKLCPKKLAASFGELPQFGADIVKRIQFKITTFTGRQLKGKIKKGVIKLKELPKPLGNFSKSSIKDSVEYIIFHQEPAPYTKPPGSGVKKLDAQNGIFHLRTSQDRGLVQGISFSKISMPSREAMLVVRNGDLYDELRLPHDATVTMFGNNLFMPLSQVYINPDTLGFGDPRGMNSAARRLGFGGYYTVERVTTVFTAGKLTTTLNLLFNSFPESTSQPGLSPQVQTSITEVTNIIKKEVDQKYGDPK